VRPAPPDLPRPLFARDSPSRESAGSNTGVVVLVHCGYWLVYLLLFSVVVAAVGAQARRPLPAPLLPPFSLVVLCVAPSLVSFYSFYFLLAPRFLARKKIFALVIFAIPVCLLSAVSGALLSPVFFGVGQAIFSDAREFFLLTATLFAVCAVHGGAALVVRGFVTWYGELALKEELARRNFETELALIKSQLNPHFLFNTINNIDILIARNPRLASEYLNKLSDILRYTVYEAGAERVPLAKELDYIEKYVELQKIRTANPGYVDFRVESAPGDVNVAPMILVPFLENAFKHAEGRKSANSIRVRVSVEGRVLRFECENTYSGRSGAGQDFGGLGNELIRRRLALTYPERHSLEVSDDGETYRVRLTLHED
jgi:two-component system LytT family sensor kinase